MKQLKPISELEKKRPTFLLLGLSITLLAVYGLFELKTEKGAARSILKPETTTEEVYQIPKTFFKKPEKLKEPVDVKMPTKKLLTDLFIAVPNQTFVADDYEDLELIDDRLGFEEPVITVDLESLDKKPIFPGCEDILDEKERFACFQSKMMDFVSSRFKPCQSTFGVSKEKIFVMFTIDEFGRAGKAEVARSTDACNTDKAVEIIAQLPTMTPARYLDKNVRTRFILPINIQ